MPRQLSTEHCAAMCHAVNRGPRRRGRLALGCSRERQLPSAEHAAESSNSAPVTRFLTFILGILAISGFAYAPAPSADNSPVAGQQFEYGIDDIGNRKSASWGGNESGGGLKTGTYSATSANQYSSVTTPPFVEVTGTASTDANVLIKDSAGSRVSPSRKGGYFSAELPVDNSSGPVWLVETNFALRPGSPDIVSNIVRKAFIPAATQSMTYDADGNLTNDGHWTYSWDGADRLTTMSASSSLPTEARQKMEFAYDPEGRRIQKKVSHWNGSVWVLDLDERFVYDGWNLIAVLDGDLHVKQSFLWGADMSGRMQGAGGIGGLLAVTDASQGTHFVAYDDNGNVVALVNATNGAISAQYEYGPFGEPISATGPMAKANPFRFSTKYHDNETDLVYYGYRYYSPTAGRWLSRDPIGVEGGANLYGFVGNDPVGGIDALGLFLWFDDKVEFQPTAPVTPAEIAKFKQQRIEEAMRYGTLNDEMLGTHIRTQLSALSAGIRNTAYTVMELNPVDGFWVLTTGEHVHGAKAGTGERAFAAASVIPVGKILGTASKLTGLAKVGTFFRNEGRLGRVGEEILSHEPGASRFAARIANDERKASRLVAAEGTATQLEFDFVKDLGPRRIPTVEFDYLRHPELADNIWHAQQAGHPEVLTRGWPGLDDINRPPALSGIPRVLSRDEYPFASTLEGGAGSWVGNIPGAQNSAQGNILMNFYRRNNVLPGDPFRVRVINHPGN
jgi:RHS repeat-associated protein